MLPGQCFYFIVNRRTVIPAVGNHFIADALHPPLHAETTFCRLIHRADLIVVKLIFFPHGNRREIRHHHIGAGQNSHFPSLRVDRAERRRRRKQHMRIHQPQDGKQPQGHLQRPRSLPAKRRVLLRNERSDSHHGRREFLNKHQVFIQRLRGLIRRAHHKAASGLITDLL